MEINDKRGLGAGDQGIGTDDRRVATLFYYDDYIPPATFYLPSTVFHFSPPPSPSPVKGEGI